MIRFHIDSTQECGVVFKLERFSHISGQSFKFGSLIGFEALSPPSNEFHSTLEEKKKKKEKNHFGILPP